MAVDWLQNLSILTSLRRHGFGSTLSYGSFHPFNSLRPLALLSLIVFHHVMSIS